jgi:hypothetical protein
MEMKIHLIQTDKPSRLFKNIKGKLGFNTEWTEIPFGRTNQNIYITDNSEIREGDWIYNEEREPSVIQCIGKGSLRGWKKIILTTDPDLIQDGVQAIDDEFLQWFVKNPSCKGVEIKYRYNFYAGQDLTHYKIIIPQEKPKQLTDLEIAIKLEEIERKELKQETLEEAAESYRRSTERKDRNGVEIFEGDYLVDRYEDEEGLHESFFQVVYCPRLMAWAIDTSYSRNGSQMVSIHDYFGDCLEVKNPLPSQGS